MESIVFWGFNLYAWITIATVLTMFTVLLCTKLRADLVFLGAISVLFVTGVLDAKEAFSGFGSNHRSAVCCSIRTYTYRCAAVDSEELAGTTQYLFEGGTAPDAACGCTEFISEQYHCGGAVCKHREDVVEEAKHLTI